MTTATRDSRPGPSGAGGVGVAMAVLTAAAFGTSGTFGSALIDAGWSPAAAVLARISVSALILTVPAAVQLRGRWVLLRRNAAGAVAFGLVAVAGCQLFYFNAIAHLPVGVALLLEYLGAVLVIGWMWLRHGQRPRKLTIWGAVIAIAGLAMVLDLSGSSRISLVGVIWALLAAVGLAAYFVLSAAPAREPLPPLAMAWAGMCVGAVTLGGLGLTGAVRITANAATVRLLGYHVSWIVPVAGLSVVAAALAYAVGIGAARRLGAKVASFISMSEVLFAILFAWLLLGQLPAPVQFAGGALILAGVTAVRVDELRGAPAASGHGEQVPHRPELAASSAARC